MNANVFAGSVPVSSRISEAVRRGKVVVSGDVDMAVANVPGGHSYQPLPFSNSSAHVPQLLDVPCPAVLPSRPGGHYPPRGANFNDDPKRRRGRGKGDRPLFPLPHRRRVLPPSPRLPGFAFGYAVASWLQATGYRPLSFARTAGVGPAGLLRGLLLFTAWPHVNLRFTVKHEKTETEDENEDEDEGCRLIPTTHWLPATGYWLLPTSETGFCSLRRGRGADRLTGWRCGGTAWFRLQGFIVPNTKGFDHVHKDADCCERYFP